MKNLIDDFEISSYSFVPKPFSKKFSSYEEMVEYTGIDCEAPEIVIDIINDKKENI